MGTGITLRRAARKASSRARRTLLAPALRVHDGPALVRLGSPGGGWWVPGDVLAPGNVAYCAGAGEDISFDLELHRRGLDVVTIDPTPRAGAHVRAVAPGDHRFHFVPVGLWHERTELTFYAPHDPRDVSHSVLNLQHTRQDRAFIATVDTLSGIMAGQGHDHIDLLKVDIEGAESSVLPDLLRAGPHPRVVCFEYDQPQSSWRLLRMLDAFRETGYRLVRRERWNFTLWREAAG
jgi:FkbM family methyltransferase